MRRREFIATGLCYGAAATAGVCARAAETPLRRVGVLMSIAETDRGAPARVAALKQTLNELGWRDGDNLRIDFRWLGGDASRAPALANELLALAPQAVVSVATVNTAALIEISRTVPIVMVSVGDPVASGFVASMAHPGRNVTGVTNYEASIGSKWLELLVQMVPRLTRTIILYNPDTLIGGTYVPSVQAAAQAFSTEPVIAEIRGPSDIDRRVADLANEPNSGLVVPPDPFMIANRRLAIESAARHRVPAIYPFGYFARDGGLLAYGVDVIDEYRQAATYVDRILRGANPADLPVEHPAKFELVVNLKTAQALALAVPRALLVRADEVIE